ncbi:MAG: phage protein Gp36 family protein [Vibrio sp.]
MLLATELDLQARYPNEHKAIVANLTRLGIEAAAAIETSLTDASYEVVTYAQQGEIEHPLLKRLTIDIALYRVCSTASMNTKDIRQRFEDAQETLKRIANHSIKLGDGEEDGNIGSPQAKAQFFTQPRRFTRNTNI